MRPWLLAIAVVAGAIGAARGQQATTAPVADVATLIKQLGDDSYQVRQEAQDRLVAAGPEAVAPLKEFLARATDPEVRTRVETAIATIEENRATGPTAVTLHVKDEPVEMVVKELSRQGGVALPTLPDNLFKQPGVRLPALTMDMDHEPLLKALRELCEKSGLRLNQVGSDRRVAIMQGGDESMIGPAVYPGAFMVVANSITRSSTVNFAHARGGASKSLSIQFSFFAEPKLNLLGHEYNLRVSQAVDDRGNSLVLPSPPYNSMGQDTSSRWSCATSLAIPDNLGTRLARLKGTSRVMLQTRSETWEVTQLSGGGAAPNKVIAGRRYVVEDFKEVPGDTYQVKLTIVREHGPAAAINQQPWQQYARGVRVSLQDAAGKELGSRGYGAAGGNEQRMSYVYNFGKQSDTGEKTGAPVKLLVEVPTEVKETEVPFEFVDLPLP